MIFLLALIVSTMSLYFDIKEAIEGRTLWNLYPRVCTSLFSLAICFIGLYLDINLRG